MPRHRTHAARRTVRRLTPAALVAPCLMLGCAGSLRTDLTLADGLELDAFGQSDAPAITLAEAAPPAVQLDRSGWERRTFLVPATTVRHHPTVIVPVARPNQTGTQRGEFPTTANILDPEGRDPARASREKQTFEGVLAFGGAALDVALSPFRALAGGFGPTASAPLYPYQRSSGGTPRPIRAPMSVLPPTEIEPALQVAPPYAPLPEMSRPGSYNRPETR